MATRRAVGVTGAVVPGLLAFGVLLSWFQCGPDPKPASTGSAAFHLEPASEVLGPPPQPGGDGLRVPPQVVSNGTGWLVTWGNRGWTRAARLDADGAPVDPAPGLLLDPERAFWPSEDVCLPVAVSGTWVVPCQSAIAILGASGAPQTVAPPWTPDFGVPDAAAGGHGLAFVRFGAEGYAVSDAGELAWQVALAEAQYHVLAVSTDAGFLLGWNEGPRFLVQTVAPDGTTAGATQAGTDGRLLGLAAGPAGVLAWVDASPQRLELLDPATGLPTGTSTTDFGAGGTLLALPDGWLLEDGAQGFRIDADLNVTPVALPFDSTWRSWAYDGTSGTLMLAALGGDLDSVEAGPVTGDTADLTLLSHGLERQEVMAVAAGPGGSLVVQEALYPDAPNLEAWRVDAAGALVDAEALRLAEDVGPGGVAVGGDGPPWLVAQSEVGALNLYALDASGGVLAHATLPCDLGTPEHPAGTDVVKVEGLAAVVRLDDGWLVGCMDAARIPQTGGGSVLAAYRHAVQRLDDALTPQWSEARTLDDWMNGQAYALVATRYGDRAVLGWSVYVDGLPALRLMEVDPDTGAMTRERQLAEPATPFGIAARGTRIAVLGRSISAPDITGALLDELDAPDVTPLRYFPGERSYDAVGPAFVGDEIWSCYSLTIPTEAVYPVECLRLRAEGNGEPVTVAAHSRVGAVAGDDAALTVGYATWRDGLVRSALATLARDGGVGDGGDAGDGGGLVGDGGDAGDAGDGGGLVGDGGDAGDAGDGGGLVEDGGDAGAAGDGGGRVEDGGDDGAAGDGGGLDAGGAGRDAGTGPSEEGGGCGCTSAGGANLLGLLVVTALGLARRGRGEGGRRARRRRR